MWKRVARYATLRPVAAAAGLTAALRLKVAVADKAHTQNRDDTPAFTPHQNPPPSSEKLPTFTAKDVQQHDSPDKGVWVVLGTAVYDITSFLENHPGGVDKITLAAGGSVEPFWKIYRQHVDHFDASTGAPVPKSHVAEALAPLQVGWLDPADVAAAEAARASRADDDPYRNEPERHPALRLLSETPCSAESPAALMHEHYTTPNELWFVRHHHPVPTFPDGDYKLRVHGLGLAEGTFSEDHLRAMPRADVTSTIQCGGNRRGEMNQAGKTSGNAWGTGAISNAEWGGVLLRDLLARCGLESPEAAKRAGVAHIIMEGADGTIASIPVDKATSDKGDVILAYEMNGEPLPRDHGSPLRAVVPGHVGVRNIKWLSRIEASAEEADGVWQRGIAYKVFGPSVKSIDESVDVAGTPTMQEMPVQSAILLPRPGTAVENEELVSVEGYAYSGGGRGIIRVDVSADGGSSWQTATLTEGASQPRDRAWAWTFWMADVKVPGDAAPVLVCKAVDAAQNVQPESADGIWNLRGLAHNAWHRVELNRVGETAGEQSAAPAA